MALAHEKISLTRSLTDLSNEYMNSLDQTKLIYDFYGNQGGQEIPFSYGLMMTPSAMNNYRPIMLTDAAGRVVLDSRYAEAARKSGIPQEGLDGLPSDKVRNMFLAQLCGEDRSANGINDFCGDYSGRGIISHALHEALVNIPYNQYAGLGDTSLLGNNTFMTSSSAQINIDGLKKYIADMGELNFEIPLVNEEVKSIVGELTQISQYMAPRIRTQAELGNPIGVGNASLLKMLNGTDYYLTSGIPAGKYQMDSWNLFTSTVQEYINWMHGAFQQILGATGNQSSGLDAAYSKLVSAIFENDYPSNWTTNDKGFTHTSTNTAPNDKLEQAYKATNASMLQRVSHFLSAADSRIIAGTKPNTNGSYYFGNVKWAPVGINMTAILEEYLTYFAEFMSMSDLYDYTPYGSKANNATKDKSFVYEIPHSESETNETFKFSNFYDTLFNLICDRGWVENKEVNDTKYLQNMLQNSKMWIAQQSDDGYYYQNNYASDRYIRVVSDSTAIAKAESKYNREKLKINQKEQEMDLKMKQLDTEISALTTEYDSVKSTISKNTERIFKRYG